MQMTECVICDSFELNLLCLHFSCYFVANVSDLMKWMFFVLCIVTRYVNYLAFNLLVKNCFGISQSIVLSICSEKRHFKMFVWPLNVRTLTEFGHYSKMKLNMKMQWTDVISRWQKKFKVKSRSKSWFVLFDRLCFFLLLWHIIIVLFFFFFTKEWNISSFLVHD